MLKLENASKFFSLQYLYNMHKTLFAGGYLIYYIMVTIFLRCSMIANKKLSVKRIEALKALGDNIFFCSISFFLSSTFLFFSLHIFFHLEMMVFIRS